jgi:hypothetical protein
MDAIVCLSIAVNLYVGHASTAMERKAFAEKRS